MKIDIRYIGIKPEETDHLYGSGLTWKQGEVKPVDVKIARHLLMHPDVWEDARSKAARKKHPVKAEAPALTKRDKTLDHELPLANLAYMTKDQMAQYAARNLGQRINPEEMSEAQMRSFITDRMREERV
jgi:hypothetical protein